MKPCPLIEVRACLHLSIPALAQLSGLSTSRIYDTEAGRIPTIPSAVLNCLRPYADVEALVKLHAAWFAGLSEAARATAEEFSRLAASFGGVIDGGNDAAGQNLQAMRDIAKSQRDEFPRVRR
jgi:hypothetical protein